ncbi:MAG TPA: hypothetical protein VMV87_20460 [Burkholderiales bacterium]|nr:hypothetical protein [Burkholderiales bacterium]
MNLNMSVSAIMAALLTCGTNLAVADQMQQHMATEAAAQAPDPRLAVEFPGPLREHELANMRDHLSTLSQIQLALSRNDVDGAAKLAENRLGMSSFKLHGAHEVAKYMPKGMQEIGSEMHRAASRFALEATSAGATGDIRPALTALALVTQQCVACHALYRLK